MRSGFFGERRSRSRGASYGCGHGLGVGSERKKKKVNLSGLEKKSFSACGRGERLRCEAVSPRLLFLEKGMSAPYVFEKLVEFVVKLIVLVKHVGYVEHRMVPVLVFMC